MITRLSTGPRHHFFGYYGICPWNSTGRHHLALQTDFHDRAPRRDDKAVVGLVAADGGEFTPFAETSAFNLQQGSMMHWIDVGFGQEFTYNDWDGERLVARAVNPRTRAKRTIDAPIAAVSPSGTTAIGLNFARMSACRRVVGYANSMYAFEGLTAIPEDDGLYQIDLRTGRSGLLVSIAAVHRQMPRFQGPHWFNHAVFNPGGTRLLFVCRMREAKRGSTSVWVADADGGNLDCVIEYGYWSSHFAWIDDESIMISTNVPGEMGFTSINTRSKEMSRMEIAEFPADGHNAFSPDFQWIVCDTYPEGPNRECRLLLHNRRRKTTLRLGSFAHPEYIHGDWRCDLHPRWSQDGRIITFDSVHEGTRQIYAADVRGIVDDDANHDCRAN